MPATVSLGVVNPSEFKGALLAIPFGDNPSLGDQLAGLDRALGGAMSRAIDAKYFRGAKDEVFHVSGAADTAARVILIGTGSQTDRAAALRRAGSIAAR